MWPPDLSAYKKRRTFFPPCSQSGFNAEFERHTFYSLPSSLERTPTKLVTTQKVPFGSHGNSAFQPIAASCKIVPQGQIPSPAESPGKSFQPITMSCKIVSGMAFFAYPHLIRVNGLALCWVHFLRFCILLEKTQIQLCWVRPTVLSVVSQVANIWECTVQYIWVCFSFVDPRSPGHLVLRNSARGGGGFVLVELILWFSKCRMSSFAESWVF